MQVRCSACGENGAWRRDRLRYGKLVGGVALALRKLIFLLFGLAVMCMGTATLFPGFLGDQKSQTRNEDSEFFRKRWKDQGFSEITQNELLTVRTPSDVSNLPGDNEAERKKIRTAGAEVLAFFGRPHDLGPDAVELPVELTAAVLWIAAVILVGLSLLSSTRGQLICRACGAASEWRNVKDDRGSREALVFAHGPAKETSALVEKRFETAMLALEERQRESEAMMNEKMRLYGFRGQLDREIVLWCFENKIWPNPSAHSLQELADEPGVNYRVQIKNLVRFLNVVLTAAKTNQMKEVVGKFLYALSCTHPVLNREVDERSDRNDIQRPLFGRVRPYSLTLVWESVGRNNERFRGILDEWMPKYFGWDVGPEHMLSRIQAGEHSSEQWYQIIMDSPDDGPSLGVM